MSSSPQIDGPEPPGWALGLRRVRRRVRRQVSRRVWPRSLTGGLIASSIALVAVVSVVVGVVTTLALREFLLQRLDNQLAAVAHGVEAAYGPGGPGESGCGVGGAQFATGPADLAGVIGGGCRGVYMSTVDSSNQTFDAREVSAADLAELSGVPAGSAGTVHIDGAGEYRVLAVDEQGARVVVGLSTNDVSETVTRLIGWEALVALLGVVAAAVGATFAVRRQLRPLTAVASTAREVARQPLDTGALGPPPRGAGAAAPR